MLILVDSNILVFTVDYAAQEHLQTTEAVSKLRQRGDTLLIIPQNIYEFWSVATRPKTARGLGLTTTKAQLELSRLKLLFRFLPDTSTIYAEWEKLVVQHSVSGKNSHDARIAAAMIAHGVTHLLTFNGTDFKRFAGITTIEPKNV